MTVIKWLLRTRLQEDALTPDNARDLKEHNALLFSLLLYTQEQLVLYLLEGSSLPWLPSFRKLTKRLPLGCPS